MTLIPLILLTAWAFVFIAVLALVLIEEFRAARRAFKEARRAVA